MIVRNLDDVVGTDRDVAAPNWSSRRFLLASDGLGYSLNDTVLHAGTTTTMWYRHHQESVYCIEGTGTLTDLETGQVHPISPGTLYVLDGNERHELHAETDLRMVCVFTPALTGREVHDADGAYPLLTDDAPSANGQHSNGHHPNGDSRTLAPTTSETS
jgi:L-ectoine synthase